MLFGDIAYDDHFNGIAEATQEGERMAAVMGGKRILFLANHGAAGVAQLIHVLQVECSRVRVPGLAFPGTQTDLVQ